MGEIVNDRNAVDFGLHFQATLHALEALQRRCNHIYLNAVVGCNCHGSSGVPDVVLSGQRK